MTEINSDTIPYKNYVTDVAIGTEVTAVNDCAFADIGSTWVYDPSIDDTVEVE